MKIAILLSLLNKIAKYIKYFSSLVQFNTLLTIKSILKLSVSLLMCWIFFLSKNGSNGSLSNIKNGN